jgi:hypothetical protein
MGKRSRFIFILEGFILVIALIGVSACGKQDPNPVSTWVNPPPLVADGYNPDPTPQPASSPFTSSTPSPTPAVVASLPTCVSSDPSHICIGIKFISYKDSLGVPVITEPDAITLINTMNSIWKVCNIGYQLEIYQALDPTAQGLAYSPDWGYQSNAVRSAFQDDTHFLVTAVGPWVGPTIAVTMMPDSGIYGTLVDAQYAHEPLAVGHELGHYQGLYHIADSSNLMNAIVGTTTTALTSYQCSIARDTDLNNWTAMMRRPHSGSSP